MPKNIKKWIGKINEAKAKLNNEEKQIEAQTRVTTLLNKNSNFLITEAYKALRTNIIFTLNNANHGCKKIIITSASPGEGKTTTCINLAIAFAQTGSKVLIVEADLRKPRVYRHLQIERKPGLSDVLGGLVELKQAVKKCEEYGIDCITAGQLPPNPVELLSSDKMGEVIDVLSASYDYIFIDTPPVTMVADATAMSKFVDGVIVVVRQNYTIHETLERARNSLNFAEAKILGYILNDVNNFSSRYGSYKNYGYIVGIKRLFSGYSGYGYGYGYCYGYGYGYSDYRDHAMAASDKTDKEPEASNYIGVDDSYVYQQEIDPDDFWEESVTKAGKKEKKSKNKK